ncbi:MAG: hydrogenase expression/formation protein HypE [Actinobacteria bacterium HGW-Actinobacteria-10]|jgi:hydrogenase expression/formation protein HypE|nr:MAG: hydrogenase expression/formation protein HypE [Actinobacteria bacterium HGW-Actinobacteria-10]
MRSDRILLAHGSGGTLMRELIEDVFMHDFDDDILSRADDAAVLDVPVGRIAMSTDTYVVSPLEFPGADIGRLAVCGTVNDIATAGAKPLYLSVGFVLEEGFEVEVLRRILVSMHDSAAEAGVRIVTGDTKVVEKGHGDGCYINTAGIGVVAHGVDLSGSHCRPGDVVLLSGTLGDHGIAVISVREGLKFGTDILSDAAPLNHLIAAVLDAAPDARCFRDPTRGGLASTLNELAGASGVSIDVDETAVPVRDQVRGACEMLGYDVYQVANEGKMVAVVPAEQAQAALEAMRSAPYGGDAAIIGEVADGAAGKVYVRTAFGARRIMDMLVGEQLPRIC